MTSTQGLFGAYIAQFSPQEKIAYEIARKHLATSFNIEKSIGFQEWLKKNPTVIYQNNANQEDQKKKD